MVPENVTNPQFRRDTTGEDAEPERAPADHSDEAMARLRRPFDPQPADRTVTPRPGDGTPA
ncbi:hypothetical protein [Actinoplanes sp. NPDC051494]|uniref:hypothetical protein n=1 Tax=Actinoplanes sp. NPDC051494 TaxID=3363907 RepID=UPI00378C83E0